MAANFTSVTVIPKFSKVAAGEGGFDVYWTIEGNTFTPNFQVSWAETESGPWTDQLTTRTTDLFAISVGPALLNQQAISWFRIQAFNDDLPLIDQVVVATSTPMDHRNRMRRSEYLFYREHLRRLRLGFNKCSGMKAWLLRRRITGSVCPVCCDELIETPASQECSTCYGTGITGGYWPVVEVMGDIGKEGPPNSPNTNDISVGPSQVMETQARIFPIPEAKSHDLWVDQATRLIFEIVKCSPIHYCGSVFEQQIVMTRLPAHHPAYRFPLPTFTP